MRLNLTIDESMPGMSEFLGGLPPEQRAYFFKVFAELGYLTWSGTANVQDNYEGLEKYFEKWLVNQLVRMGVNSRTSSSVIDTDNNNDGQDRLIDDTTHSGEGKQLEPVDEKADGFNELPLAGFDLSDLEEGILASTR